MECKDNTGYSASEKTEIMKNALPVIFGIGIITAVAGLGSMICGALVLAFSVDYYYWPFPSGSGLWCGIMSLSQGILGILVWKNFNVSFPRATKHMVHGFYVMGIIGLSVAPQHLSYSIMGLAKCTGMELDRVEDAKCNPKYQDELIYVQVFNIVFAAFYDITSIITLGYMLTKRRIAILTGDSRFYRGCMCCNQVNYEDV